MTQTPPPNPEREQTDESLRSEREQADLALGEELAEIDETADAVINKARDRADALLAGARADTDRQTESKVGEGSTFRVALPIEPELARAE